MARPILKTKRTSAGRLIGRPPKGATATPTPSPEQPDIAPSRAWRRSLLARIDQHLSVARDSGMSLSLDVELQAIARQIAAGDDASKLRTAYHDIQAARATGRAGSNRDNRTRRADERALRKLAQAVAEYHNGAASAPKGRPERSGTDTNRLVIDSVLSQRPGGYTERIAARMAHTKATKETATRGLMRDRQEHRRILDEAATRNSGGRPKRGKS